METKTVLVTGASRGIGKAIALAYADLMYNIIITCSKSQKSLQEVENSIIKRGAKCLAFVGNMGNPQTVDQLFYEIERKFEGVDILINNAGISYIGLITDMKNEDWSQLIDTNLSSVFFCSRGAIPNMVRRKSGKIINISSVWGLVGASCEVAYSAAKAGVHGLTKALAKELAPSNVQVNALALGVINTGMNECFTTEEREYLREEIPVGRFAEPEEIAEIILNITKGNDYMTGQVISVDGGWV